MATSSAPGKVILFGEHAVVYNRPALAVPVTQIHADVEVRDSARAGIWIEAPEIDLHAEVKSLPSGHPLVSVINDVILPLGISPFPNLEIKISSTIPVASGLGSGAAVTVALARALSSFLLRPMTDDEVNLLAYEIEKLHHGTPSGIDNTVVTYAKPVYFVKGQPIETFRVGEPFTIVIADTGLPAPTKESVGDVRRLWLKDTSHFENIFDEIAQISLMARRAIESGNPKSLGELMNQNHGFLQEMTISCSELDNLVETARGAGALGAKLSGGGRGGNMIALVNDNQAGTVSAALMGAGARRVIVAQVA